RSRRSFGVRRQSAATTALWIDYFLSIQISFCYSHGMSSNLDQLTADAMKLPLRDRVQLAQRLVETLDDEVEPNTEALSFAEGERRLEELRSGKVEGIESDEAFRSAREALKR